MTKAELDTLISQFLSEWGYPDAGINAELESDLRALIANCGVQVSKPKDEPLRRPRRAYRLDEEE
jgi:hypothetical protein